MSVYLLRSTAQVYVKKLTRDILSILRERRVSSSVAKSDGNQYADDKNEDTK